MTLLDAAGRKIGPTKLAPDFETRIRADERRQVARTIRECSAKASERVPDAPDRAAVSAFAEVLADVLDAGANVMEGRHETAG